MTTASKNNGASGDQARQIEELRKKLADSEAKSRDLGSFCSLTRIIRL